MNIKGQSFLKLLDFTPEQIAEFWRLPPSSRQRKRPVSPTGCARASRLR